jgi:uncharacterized membrane protein YfcA
LAGLLGIGGGLIFAPLLLWLNLPPHQALATSSFAIVPTALAGTIVHLQSGSLPTRSALAIGLAGFGSAFLFGGLGGLVAGWVLLAMQTAVYVLLAFTIKEPPKAEAEPDPNRETVTGIEIEKENKEEITKPVCSETEETSAPLLAGVGCIAGWTAGMLGLGGGLVLVPLMSGPFAVPIHRAIRLSTVAVLCSASAASLQFLHEGRGIPWMGLTLGSVAALAAQWSARRLDLFDSSVLVRCLRGLAIVLAIDSSRRAIQLVLN